LFEHLLVFVLVATILLGTASFAALRADRRRQNVAQRLKAIGGAASARGEAEPSLRRARPEGRLRRLFLRPGDLQRRFDAALAATGDRVGLPHLAIVGSIVAVLVIFFCLRLLGLGPIVAVVAGIAAAAGAGALVVRLAQSRYQRRFLDAFPDGLDLLARAVRAGLPVFDAMEVAAREISPPVGGEFRRMIDEMRIGVEIEEALQRAAARIRVPDFRFFVVALTLQRRTGGHLAETLNNLSNIIRRRKEIRLKARALTAQARASAVVLSVLPFLVGIALVFIAHSLMQVLWADPRGRFMVGVALIMLIIGSVIMQVMIRRSLR
jgi:tight adherence protein B